MKVLLDTNVIVSAVTTRGLCADVFRAVLSDHELVICPLIFDEVRRILRAKFSVPNGLIDEYIRFLSLDSILVDPGKPPSVNIKDKDDAEILGAALSGGANVLVTGDKELLGVKALQALRILSPREFWDELTSRQKT